MLSVVQTSPRAVCILSAVGSVAIVDVSGWLLWQWCFKIREERTSRVAPNGHSKRRRVSTNQTLSIKKGPLGCSQRSQQVEGSFNKSDCVHSDLYINLEVSSGSMASVFVWRVFVKSCCHLMFQSMF
ncbi:uncharacterized protein LOC131303340 [Rhododendron vialii]|uniref:uncharacterized protein LOC131303340 n=1 Tax=Rhododendron vialii TaxID=182163 RepID=UPI00265DB333|nr:uncharacterized protein LOC131303340 [Rhododendron vialii]